MLGPVDENDQPVKRTKANHPYAYDSFIQERVLPNSEVKGSVYSDRLLDWDYNLTRSLMKKHFGNDGDYWTNRSAADIQNFLRERLNKPDLEVCYVMECCNQATGYPLWFIAYK
jgi:hypothetical protein